MLEGITCWFKGHVYPYEKSFNPDWILNYKGPPTEILNGYVCRRCLKFQIRHWFILPDMDTFPVIEYYDNKSLK